MDPLLAQLREAIHRAEKGHTPAVAPTVGLPTGLAEVDAVLGGFPRGRVAELLGAWSSGKTSVALAAAARATQGGGLVAWVDSRRELCPPAAAAHGVELARLLVVRPPGTAAALARAVEILADGRVFALIVVDVPDRLRIEGTAAARLRVAAQAGDAAVVLLAGAPVAVGVTTLRAHVDADGVVVGKGGAGPGARARRPAPAIRPEAAFWPEDVAEQLTLLPGLMKSARRAPR